MPASAEETQTPAASVVTSRKDPSPDTKAAEDAASADKDASSADAEDKTEDPSDSSRQNSEEETTAEEKLEPLSFGMKGDKVTRMQKALADLGYPGFIADGDYGENSENAIRLFQFYNNLPATGEADVETLSVLYGDSAERYSVLSRNSSGNAVRYVQEYLSDAGFLLDDPDGSYGPGTEDAVWLYQAAAGIASPDGSVGKDTALRMTEDPIIFKTLKINDSGVLVTTLQQKLQELGFLKQQSIAETQTAADPGADAAKTASSADAGESSGPVASTFDEATEQAVKEFQMYAGLDITGEADAETCSAIFRKTVSFKELGRGAKGDSVETLQMLLKDLGYLTEEPDGSFGNATKQAVRDFQVVNGLSRDGSFGKKTADTLFDDPLPYDQEVLDNAGNDAEAFAKEVLDEIGWDLYAAFEWSVGLRYGNQNTGYNTTDSAIYSFINHTGNCLGMATTFYWMAKALGYEAYAIEGKVPYRDADFGEHAWVEVVIDGVTYVCDPDFEWQEKKNGYMIRYGQSGTWQYEYGYVLSD